MSTVRVRCPKCATSYQVDDALVGKKARCKKSNCGTTFIIQAAARATMPSADPAAAAAPGVREWQVGDTILDLYAVKGVLGEGGMGKVYRVHHKGWDLDLAVKSPRPQLLTRAGAAENFEREAETWVNLGLHPHTASCYYVRRIDGIPRVFAELIEGGDLAGWIRKGKLYEGGPASALERIVDIAIQFAWGLHFAHESGLVHQDVKPANVLMTADRVAKVTDFGLARARSVAGEAMPQTVAGQSILVSSGGMTPAYCSPEQANRQKLTRATDIWSWAVSVLEMFTGDVTWSSGTAAAEALAGYHEIGTGDARLPAMPHRLADLLDRCLQRDPHLRPASMAEIADGLQEIYRTVGGRRYPRELPQTAETLAATLNNRAVSLHDLGRQDRARALLREAGALDPFAPEPRVNAALLADDATRLHLLRHAVAQAPGIAWPRGYLARLASGYEALEVRREALLLFPEDAALQQALTADPLPLVLSRIGGATDLAWSRGAARLRRDGAAARQQREWPRVAELTRQLLQVPHLQRHPELVANLRDAAAHTGARILHGVDAALPAALSHATAARSTAGVWVGVELGANVVHGGVVLAQPAGEPALRLVSFPALVLVTDQGELRPAGSHEEVRDWAARLIEAGVPLQDRAHSKLHVLEADRPIDGVCGVILGARPAMDDDPSAWCAVRDIPITVLDVAACLLAEARRRLAAVAGAEPVGLIQVNHAASSYRPIAGWMAAAAMAGFKETQVVNGPAVALLARGDAVQRPAAPYVMHLGPDAWTVSFAETDDGVVNTEWTGCKAVEPLADALLAALAAVPVSPALADAVALRRLDLATGADRSAPDRLRTLIYPTAAPTIAALLEDATCAWMVRQLQAMGSEPFRPSTADPSRFKLAARDTLFTVGMPVVQTEMREHLRRLIPGMRLDDALDAETGVARGLAMQGGILSQVVRDRVLFDGFRYGLGLAARAPESDADDAPDGCLPADREDLAVLSHVRLIEKGEIIPTAHRHTFAPWELSQDQMWVQVREGDSIFRASLFETLFYCEPRREGALIEIRTEVSVNSIVTLQIVDLATQSTKQVNLCDAAARGVVAQHWQVKGTFHAGRGELWAAERAFELATEFNAYGAAGWQNRARVLVALRRFSEARFCLARAGELEPGNSEIAQLRRECEAKLDAELQQMLAGS